MTLLLTSVFLLNPTTSNSFSMFRTQGVAGYESADSGVGCVGFSYRDEAGDLSPG